MDDLLTDCYYAQKRANGYSDTQIIEKRRSLRGVLVNLKPEWNEELLKGAGFTNIQMFWRHLNFCGWVAKNERRSQPRYPGNPLSRHNRTRRRHRLLRRRLFPCRRGRTDAHHKAQDGKVGNLQQSGLSVRTRPCRKICLERNARTTCIVPGNFILATCRKHL